MKKEKDRLSKITLSVAKSYTNKAISALSEVVRYIGVTTTEISDGSTTNPITIDGSSVTAVAGDTVFYEGSAYAFDGTKWQETISFAEVITDIETINGEIGDLTALTTLVKSSIVAAINELNEKKTNLSVVAALFDASVSYAVGDYCTKDGLFYKCTTAHTGAWDANDFQAVVIGSELNEKVDSVNGCDGDVVVSLSVAEGVVSLVGEEV